MKRLSILSLIIIVSLSAYAINEEKETAKESGSASFQPKPLDDEWSKWLIGKWEITAVHSDLLADESDASGESNAEVGGGYTIEFRLNGQFVIWEKWAETGETGGMTDEQKKQVKEALGKYVSDEELERFVSMPYRSLLIQTIDPKTGERIAYCFDSQRLYGQGRGRLEGNKEVMEWKWSGIGRGLTSVSIMEKMDENRLTISMTYTLPGGGKMEEGLALTRKKETSESVTRTASHAEDLAAVEQIAEDPHAAWLTDDPESLLALHADDAVVMVSMASGATNQENEIAKKDVPSSFQPKPLDDDWSKWLVGEWKGIVGLGGIKSEACRDIEPGLNGQFLITKHEHKVTNEEIQKLKKITHISDEDVKRYQSLPFKYLEIWTIDPKNGEVIGYFFDSLRRVAEGKGKLQGNKEIVEWQWFAQGQRAFSSIHIMEKVSDDRFITTKKYILPDGSTMEGKVEMTRKKTKTEK